MLLYRDCRSKTIRSIEKQRVQIARVERRHTKVRVGCLARHPYEVEVEGGLRGRRSGGWRAVVEWVGYELAIGRAERKTRWAGGGGGGGDGGGGACFPFSSANCKFISYPLYNCSPPITSPSTQATLSFNLLLGPGSLLSPSCDGVRHTQFDLVVSISTGWFLSGNLCGRSIRISASNGRTVVARVVAQCNSASGCRGLRQPPCGNNVIEATSAIFRALGLPILGSQSVQWTLI
ncbi:hypothetical protein QJS04_geneDACA000319 [Acorus gramineus]|uniref:Uncharacterized protein n=1 Tax=Acorus gramineus TaxID=55184 RepID=A0AAV9AUM9_ACOGR|nr:hypothetical protein QJS04_geneDACA000319 [Acorus gramineus]